MNIIILISKAEYLINFKATYNMIMEALLIHRLNIGFFRLHICI